MAHFFKKKRIGLKQQLAKNIFIWIIEYTKMRFLNSKFLFISFRFASAKHHGLLVLYATASHQKSHESGNV